MPDCQRGDTIEVLVLSPRPIRPHCPDAYRRAWLRGLDVHLRRDACAAQQLASAGLGPYGRSARPASRWLRGLSLVAIDEIDRRR